MKLGPRLSLSTVTLVILAVLASGLATVRIRRAELRADLERETESVGNALQIALEAALQGQRRAREALALHRETEARCTRACAPGFALAEGLAPALAEVIEAEDVARLVNRIRARERSLGIAFVESGAGATETPPLPDGGEDDPPAVPPPPPGPSQEARVRYVRISGSPFGEHLEVGGRPGYVYTVPIRDERQNVVAAVDLTRDATEEEAALGETVRNVALSALGVAALLSLLVWLSVRSGVTEPVGRLVEGIDEVSRGDLTRALLRERDDEIGDLADRFNQMTASLREARAETQRGAEARLALEARLRHSEKLATIGQLAAGIAHEVGTPLGVIGGRARTMEKKASDPGEVQKNAAIIADQTTRITKIIQQLLDYARKKVAVRGPVDLGKEIKSSLDFLEHQLQGRRIVAQLRPFARGNDPVIAEAPLVSGDADQLQQVCLNLCLNAVQAMPEGGTLDVSLHGLRRRKPGLDTAPASPYVVLEVADTGVGIPPEDRERIFEPFYSTKQDDGGTGLGLSVSQGIVKDHDGWIELDGRPGGGTIFRVFLPACEERI